MEKPFLVAGNTAMTERFLLIIFIVFVAVIILLATLQIFRTDYCSLASALDATHARTLHAGSGECASSFIPEFCADKLGRRTNQLPAI